MFDVNVATNNETIEFKVIPRVKNSEYKYDKSKSFTFKGRIANVREKKIYRLQAGVNTNQDTSYIYATNLPQEIHPGDQIEYLGQIQTVKSIGYYYDVNGIFNSSIFSDEYIQARSPKGVVAG